MTINEALKKLAEAFPDRTACVMVNAWEYGPEFSGGPRRRRICYVVWDTKHHHESSTVEGAVTACLRWNKEGDQDPDAAIEGLEEPNYRKATEDGETQSVEINRTRRRRLAPRPTTHENREREDDWT